MRPTWMLEALCQHFPALPWIEEPTERAPATVRAMEVVCRACPVRAACEAYVERVGVSSGFWAGCDRTPPELIEPAGGAA